MWKKRLCLNVMGNEMPIKEQIALFKKVGFEGFFIVWKKETDLLEIREYADSIGMYFQSVHAPFLKAADMWRGGEAAEVALAELLECLECTYAAGVKILVCHAWIGFNTGEVPTEVGIENYRKLVLRAAELGVKIAFENTEGEEFLDALLRAFATYKNVGFCLDTGHELCYNRGKDLLAIYGDRLIATHINDNLGIKDINGGITFKDDLHLLPFDGIKNWDTVARRIRDCGYNGELTFELTRVSKPDRHDNDVYRNMPFELYVTEAYKRACRVAALVMAED